MTKLVIFDSLYGNTQKIAQAIGQGIGSDAKVCAPKDLGTVNWSELKLLVVGSPTQGGKPTAALQQLFASIPAGALHNVRVASFDTRYKPQSGFAMRIIMNTIGYAAEKIAKVLEAKGGTFVGKPEPFIVTGKEGPLAVGEIERAVQWGQALSQ